GLLKTGRQRRASSILCFIQLRIPDERDRIYVEPVVIDLGPELLEDATLGIRRTRTVSEIGFEVRLAADTEPGSREIAGADEREQAVVAFQADHLGVQIANLPLLFGPHATDTH